MIDFIVLFKIISVFTLAVMSPGPDFMVVISMALTRGRSEGIKTAAGIASVIFLYTLISLTGLSALIVHYLWMIAAIKICGGLYLLYLGIATWKATFAKAAPTAQALPTPSRRSAFVTGALTSLTNPKAIAFFASIFALALTPDTNIATQTAIGLSVPLIAFTWFSFVAFGLSKAAVRARYQRWQRTIDRITGSVLAAFGLKLILSARLPPHDF